MRKRATKQQIAITLGLLVAVAAGGFWWAPHIHWSYLMSRNNIRISPVKVVDMPDVKPAAGWFACRAGAVSFKLPPQMAEEAERAVSKTPQVLTLTTPTHELTVLVPFEFPADRKPEIAKVAALFHLSPIQFVAESFRTGTDDFRWTMSRDELARHQNLLALWPRYPHTAILSVETRFDESLEGLLIIHESRSQAKFEWASKSGKTAGFLIFNATKGELDLDDVRAVCGSLACDESRLGPELSKDQFAVLTDTMEIAPE